MKCGDYIDISPRVRLLNTGVSLDNKELISLEQIVKTASKGHARFTSNVMAIVGEGTREAEVKVLDGVSIRTTIPRHIDRILKTHNTITQEALNALTFVWVYASNAGNIAGNVPPYYVASGTGSLVFVESSGQQISFSPTVVAVPNGTSSFTFLFLVNDTSTNSYTTSQEQLFPMVLLLTNSSGSAENAYQLSIPLSTANLVVSKSSNQILTFIWAVQLNFSSGISTNNAIQLFYPGILTSSASYGNSFCGNQRLTASSGSTVYFSGIPGYYFINVNGVLYAVAIATDASSNSYTPSSISAPYWGYQTTNCGTVYYLTVSTPPNPPGSKPAYAAVSWYNAFYLTS